MSKPPLEFIVSGNRDIAEEIEHAITTGCLVELPGMYSGAYRQDDRRIVAHVFRSFTLLEIQRLPIHDEWSGLVFDAILDSRARKVVARGYVNRKNGVGRVLIQV